MGACKASRSNAGLDQKGNDMTTETVRLVSHLSTPDEIARFAMEGNHAILWHATSMYRSGKYTWPQAMQVAAFAQAETIAMLNKKP